MKTNLDQSGLRSAGFLLPLFTCQLGYHLSILRQRRAELRSRNTDIFPSLDSLSYLYLQHFLRKQAARENKSMTISPSSNFLRLYLLLHRRRAPLSRQRFGSNCACRIRTRMPPFMTLLNYCFEGSFSTPFVRPSRVGWPFSLFRAAVKPVVACYCRH